MVSLTSMLLFHFFLPVSSFVLYPWSLLGVIPLLAGIALNLLADTALKKAQTTVKPFEVSTTLITTGVFRLCRHPMYLGMVLMVSGVAVILGTYTPLFIAFIFAVLMELVFVRMEERMLAAQFGDVWDDYRKRVRKWI